jgi:dolichol-phosphate mannosyltransferase
MQEQHYQVREATGFHNLGSNVNALPDLSIIAPSYNERINIRPLAAAIASAMEGLSYELIIVDDDSPDGTYMEVAALELEGAPVRCIRRVGRRGLSSAVVEGALASRSDFLAVIDADMQHDETILPHMLQILRTTHTDIVIGSRHVEGGSLGEWGARRKFMSGFATLASRLLIRATVNDPLSGFFMTRRSLFESSIYDLSQQGYKILLDLLTASRRQLKIVEIPYVFRNREFGESKLDIMVVAEFGFLLVERLTKGLIPPKFLLFSIVGGLGLAVHLTILNILKELDAHFILAQSIATICAMTFNFFINNSVTYRSNRLRGSNLFVGYLLFCAACSMGAIANVSVANFAVAETANWQIAGIAGAVMSSVFNFGVATTLVWGRKRKRPIQLAYTGKR